MKSGDQLDLDIDEMISTLIQASPPVTVSVITILGLTLHEWVYVATIIYTIVAIATLIKKHWLNKDNEQK
nr:MAG TPA: holin [Caudoviricetes sp.]